MERDDPQRAARSPEEREEALMKALPAVVSHVFAGRLASDVEIRRWCPRR